MGTFEIMSELNLQPEVVLKAISELREEGKIKIIYSKEK